MHLLRIVSGDSILVGGGLTFKNAGPVIGRLSVALRIISWWFPYIPVSVRAVFGFARLFEPFMLVAGMVHHQVQHKLHPTFMKLIFEHINVVDISILGVNGFVVTDIIPLCK